LYLLAGLALASAGWQIATGECPGWCRFAYESVLWILAFEVFAVIFLAMLGPDEENEDD